MVVFQNDVSEQEQRWGARTIEGSGRKEHIRYSCVLSSIVLLYCKSYKRECDVNHSSRQVAVLAPPCAAEKGNRKWKQLILSRVSKYGLITASFLKQSHNVEV